MLSHAGLKTLIARRFLIGFSFRSLNTMAAPQNQALGEATLLIFPARLTFYRTNLSAQCPLLEDH